MTGRERFNELAIYTISFFSMVAYSIPPALALIAKDFSWIGSTQIQLIITLPSLAMLPTAILAPIMQKKYSIKTLFLYNFILTLLMGIAPFFLKNFTLILITRAFSGFSLGFIQILVTYTITTRFEKSQQGRVMGGRSIASGTGAMALALVGGILADVDWRLTFLLFIVMVPAFIVTWFGLNKMEPIILEPKPAEKESVKKKRLDAITLFICISCVIHVIFLQCFTTNVSLFIDAEHYGTASISGIGMLAFNFSGPVFGFMLAPLYRRFKGKTMFVGFLSSAVGILLVGLAFNVYMVYIGGFFAGLGMSSYLGIGPLDITATIPKERAAIGVSLLAVTLFLGTFLSPYVVNPMANLIQGDSIRMRFLFASVMLFIQAFLFEVIRRRRFSNNYSNQK